MRWQNWVALSALVAGVSGCSSPPHYHAELTDELLPACAIMNVDAEAPVILPPAAPSPIDKPLPINLPTALQLSGVSPLDINVAWERIRAADAELARTRTLWLPTLYLGADYFRHDGQIQDVAGDISGTSKSALMVGAGPSAVFAVTDAIFAPLAARQQLRAREAALQTSRNDSMLAVAEAYFNVLQACGELAGAEDAAWRAEKLLRTTGELAKDLVAPVDEIRARIELARRRQLVETAREHWRTASAELVRILRLESTSVVVPLEQPHMRVTLLPPESSLDSLLAIAQTYRPELAAQQAEADAAQDRLTQERWRPLIPSVLLRGASTNPGGTLAGGLFGGGRNESLDHFSARSDFDVQLVWEWQNLGLGNRAQVQARDSQRQLASLEAVRIGDRIAEEVTKAHAQVQSAAVRVAEAESALRDSMDSADKHVEGMKQTTKVGNVLVLVIRPQEAVASIQTLGQTYSDYYAAVADYNRAQFRLYRALGHPAQAITDCPNLTDEKAP